MLISFRTQRKQTDSFLAKRLTCQPEREGESERERHRDRKGGIVGGGGDALGDFASVLCTAIVHQSLLEAKPVRTEQRFPRDLSLSAGMPKRKFNPKAGSNGWTDTLAIHCDTFAMPASQDERLCYLTSSLSCIIGGFRGFTFPDTIISLKNIESAHLQHTSYSCVVALEAERE